MKIVIELELGQRENALIMANTILSILQSQLKDKRDRSKEEPTLDVMNPRSIHVVEMHE